MTIAANPPEIRITWFACTFIFPVPLARYVAIVVLSPRRAALDNSDAREMS
jgi:hypothetical protein